jgi:predicted amidophosphoribosyltransferase
MYLNAFYGVHEYRTALPLEPGQVVELFCPSCGVSLADLGTLCAVCKIPMFSVHLGDGGQVAACPKIGCHNHRLVVVDFDAQLGRIYEDAERKMVM